MQTQRGEGRPEGRGHDTQTLLGLAECGATTFEAANREFADLTSPNVKRLEGMSGSCVSASEMFSGSTEFDSQNREMRMKYPLFDRSRAGL